MSFKKYIKAVGTGPKGNRDLEESEVIDAIELILENKVTQAQNWCIFNCMENKT